MSTSQEKCRVLRIDGVRAATGLSRSAIYDKGCRDSKYFDPTFPVRFKISERSVAWDAQEISEWVRIKKEQRVDAVR